MEQRRFVIGDIHGCFKTLNKLLFDICKIDKADLLFFLGDFIDRGHDSKKVIDLIIYLKENGYKIRALKGNHEEMLIDSSMNDFYERYWLANGSQSTLDSFGMSSAKEFEKKYMEFFFALENYVLLDDFILTHAGFNFNSDTPFSDIRSMLWDRTEFVEKEKIRGRKLVSGHTPKSLDSIKKSIITDRIWLDGGCVYKDVLPQLGSLCALELNSLSLYHLENCEKEVE